MEMQAHLDMSTFGRTKPLYQARFKATKRVVGKLKNEVARCPIAEIFGLGGKIYSVVAVRTSPLEEKSGKLSYLISIQ